MKIIGRFLSALAILAWSAGAFAQAPNFPLNSMVPNSAGGGGGSTSLAISSTPITGGTNTRVLFDDSGTVGEDAGLTYNKATDALAIVGSVAIGTASSATGQLTLANSASAFLTTIQAGNAAAARTYTWPTNFGAAGTVLTDAAGNGTLSWAAPASGLTIGTTAITSGTTTRILYDNAGVVGEYTLTGTGTVVAMQTAPTFLTSITHGVGPAILTSPAAASTQIGAADVASGAVAQTLTFQGNTGATTTGPLALIKGAGGGSGAGSIGGEVRIQGGLTAAAGTGGAITFYTAPSGAGATPALALTIDSAKVITVPGSLSFPTGNNLSTIGAAPGVGLTFGGANYYFMFSNLFMTLTSGHTLGWSASSANAAQDVNFSRVSAGIAQLGTSAANALGSLNLTGLTASGAIKNTGITSDAALTDTTVCQDTTNHQFYFGSGTLGICLGTSGRQFKTDFAPMTAGLNELMQLPLWNYRYLNGYGDGGKRMQFGLTAQDVERVMPILAGHNDNGETINYDYGALLFVSIRAIQELKADNDNIRAELKRAVGQR